LNHQRVRLFLAAVLAAMATPALFASSIHIPLVRNAQILAPAKPAAHVQITEGPEVESVHGDLVIIRWTSNNPGGTDDHYGVVHYGTDPEHLDRTAKSGLRLNQNHPTTVFRVRVEGLNPKTTYYYAVDSTQALGKSDGVKSPTNHFTTP
jgi:phosphodiesterase/alkaline phosphatase D-like protein